MKYEYKKGDLFSDPPKGVFLAHACNGLGRWGSGVAAQFATHYPISNQEYLKYCEDKNKSRELVGDCFITSEKIGCLITSHKYGREVDSPDMIVQATKKALESLIEQLNDGDEVHMPLINSNLFRVPWNRTEECIKDVLSNSNKDIKIVVWEYDK